MRWWWWALITLLLILGVLAAMIYRFLQEKPAPITPITREHEAAYQLKLQGYANILKPGMSRRSVEAYLQSKGIKFRQMCCIDERGAFADLVRIGKEKPPWWCGEYNAYIAFQFRPSEPRRPRVLEEDSDILTKITIYYWLENCL